MLLKNILWKYLIKSYLKKFFSYKQGIMFKIMDFTIG